MAAELIKERREALEREIAQIREKYKDQPPAVVGRTSPDFLEKYTGMFANDPVFDEMIRSIEEERERERREARGGNCDEPVGPPPRSSVTGSSRFGRIKRVNVTPHSESSRFGRSLSPQANEDPSEAGRWAFLRRLGTNRVDRNRLGLALPQRQIHAARIVRVLRVAVVHGVYINVAAVPAAGQR